MTTVDLILDCQYGSTGKGLFAGYLAASHRPDTIAYAPSPNAGHTLIWGDKTYMHKMLPSGITSPDLLNIVLGPGSLIDLDRLEAEIDNLDNPILRYYVHSHAACVYARHRETESVGGTAPGSTRQGVGAAQIERIRRRPDEHNIIVNADHPVMTKIKLVNTAEMQALYQRSTRLQVESCQGYSLSIYHGQYPHVTCRDVTVASILSDTGVPYTRTLRSYGTFRTYPIRVANRPADREHSGPSYPDSEEITFASIGQRQELTTVTRLPRRLFTFSQQQAIEACAQNRIDYGFLNFCNYPPDYATLHDIWERLSESCLVQYLGFGPSIKDVYRVSSPSISRAHIKDVYDYHRQAAG